MVYKLRFHPNVDPFYGMWLSETVRAMNTGSKDRNNFTEWLDIRDLGIKYTHKDDKFIRTYEVIDMKKYLLTKIRYGI